MFGLENRKQNLPFSSDSSHNSLNPLSPSSVNIQLSSCQAAKKRKYDDISAGEGIGGPFDIKPPTSSLSNKSLRLVPKLLISRLNLPLAFLEPVQAIAGSDGTQLFSARIPVLESQLFQNGNLNEPTVLIAASHINSNLYAIERAGAGIYVLCKLNVWVKLKDLEASSIQHHAQATAKRYERRINSGSEWWHAAAIEGGRAFQSSQLKKQKYKHLERVHLCLKPPLSDITSTLPTVESVPSLSTSEQVADEAPSQPSSQNPDEIFEMIKSNYQEALYVSQVSLAYFAKGPLSRARALLQSNVESSPNSIQLSELLRSCILNLPVLDKKYKDTVPEIVNGLPAEVLSDGECGAFIDTLRKKSRRSKKSKIGKNGLYPEEEVDIAKWWISRNGSVNLCDLAREKEDGRDKARMLYQKQREIQLQIILILEILALEVSVSTAGIKQNDMKDGAEGRVDPAKGQKPKKLKDVRISLDLLIDRLCIWQSTNNEELGAARSENETEHGNSNRPWIQESETSILRDFCVDVVLPFYGARLPDLSTMLCKRLGGPKQPSPKRPLLPKAATSSQSLIRPGAALQRRPSQKSRRTLERVLTDDRMAARRPSPALLRSATDSMLPSLKREVSDVSISSLPMNKIPLHKLKRYSQREVDLGLASQANEAKLKKKAGVERELQNAIAALKRPNPRMAVKEFVEAADKRAVGSRLPKVKNPIKNQNTQGVQVMVTPSVSRRKDVFSGLPRFSQASTVLPPELEDIPPSSGLRVIASTPRMRASETNNRGSHHIPPVEQTPTRGPLKFVRSISAASLDVSQHHVAVQSLITPTKSKHSFHIPSMTEGFTFSLANKVENTGKMNSNISNEQNSSQEVQDTPIKALMARPKVNFSNLPSFPKADDSNKSIYEQLGWDDVDDLL